jgi:hypothetical protein
LYRLAVWGEADVSKEHITWIFRIKKIIQDRNQKNVAIRAWFVARFAF